MFIFNFFDSFDVKNEKKTLKKYFNVFLN